MLAAGASIGAFNAVAVTCRYPQLFRAALAMSGSYDLEALMGFQGNGDYYFSSPLAFLPGLEGPLLDRLRQRFIVMPVGQGRWENPGESWRMAEVLGAKGVPNRVDPWGPNTTTTGQPGARCCRSIWTTWRLRRPP